MRALDDRPETAELEQLEARLRRLRYVKQLRVACAEPRELTQEEARVEACRDAGVPAYGPL